MISPCRRVVDQILAAIADFATVPCDQDGLRDLADAVNQADRRWRAQPSPETEAHRDVELREAVAAAAAIGRRY
jgi:hypothetical protein